MRIMAALVLAVVVGASGAGAVAADDTDPATLSYQKYQDKVESWSDKVNATVKWAVRTNRHESAFAQIVRHSGSFLIWADDVDWDACYADEADKMKGRIGVVGYKALQARRAMSRLRYGAALRLTRQMKTAYLGAVNYYKNTWSDC